MRGKRFLGAALFHLRFLPRLFRRFKFWFLLILFIVLLAVLAPWVGFLQSILKGVGRLLLPILESRVGRFMLVNAVVLVAVVFLYRRFKARGRKLLGSWALDRFLAGLMHLSAGRYRRAASRFEKVVRVGRWVNLAEAADAYPDLLPQARIKLALACRELGELDRAMKSLELLKVRDLSPGMRRELAEAKAFVYSLSDELMPETIDREIGRALEGDSGNRRLLKLRRDRAERLGDLPVAIESQRRIVKGAMASEKGRERMRLAVLHARQALALHGTGRDDEARTEISRSRSCDAGLVMPSLIAGDIALRRGEPQTAVKEWSRNPSLPGLERIRAILASGEIQKGSEVAALARGFPRAGILLVLAEYYLREGKRRKARNCLRKLEDLGLLTRHGACLFAEIHRQEGDEQGANRLEWRALKGFLGAEPPSETV